jgi:hypothetical protein
MCLPYLSMCVVTSEVLWGPEKGRNSRAGRTSLMNTSEAPATAGWLVLVTTVFLASAAGWLWAGRRVVHFPTGLGNCSRSRLTVLLLGDLLLLCVLQMSCLVLRVSPTDWLACRRSASLFAVTSGTWPHGNWCYCGLCWLASVVVRSHNYLSQQGGWYGQNI